MDFAFSAEEEAFRADLRAFLDDELPHWWRGMFVDDARAMPFTREMCRMLAERGWLTLAWPTEYGGSGASVWLQTILREEMWAREEPRGPQYMNLNYIGPLIMRFGTPEQRDRFLPPMSGGGVIWAQGFSEPDAGSDLASLATRAEEDLVELCRRARGLVPAPRTHRSGGTEAPRDLGPARRSRDAGHHGSPDRHHGRAARVQRDVLRRRRRPP
jgi:alkylation response protein AidB-like acyl-CoA dehydrogenase